RWHWYAYETSPHVLDFCLSKRPAMAHGCYRLLLDAMWKRGCSLPRDRQILYQLAGCRDLEQYEEVADVVEACFRISDDEKSFTSDLLTNEWNTGTDILEKRRRAGQKGGKASAQANVEQTSTIAQASSSSSSSSIKTSLSCDELIARIRGIGSWRAEKSITAEHELVDRLAGGADPTELFNAMCRIHRWTEGGKFAPKLAEVINRWNEPQEFWERRDRNVERVTKVELEAAVGRRENFKGNADDECICYVERKTGNKVICPNCYQRQKEEAAAGASA
ncbi:MAG: DUF1376 domain-containing protein, partial [Candidatus Acidiferrum sp.]